MKETTLKIAVAAMAVAMAFGGASVVNAKAHDQGQVDENTPFPDANNAGERIRLLTEAGVLDGKGVSALTSKGARGCAASGGKGSKCDTDG